MKILLVNTNPTAIGGITNVIFNLLENINDPTLQFGYISINTPSEEFVEKLGKLKCKLHIVPRNIKNVLSYLKTLSYIAKDYDAIHVHGNSATLAIDFCAARIGGIRYRIAHSHSTACRMVIADKILRPLFYRLCNRRLACGKAAGKWLYGNRGFEIIQNGINTSRFRFNSSKRLEIRKSLGWENKLVIGHVGNFMKEKNHKFIFDITKFAIGKNKDIRLLCVGSGRLMDEARDYLSKQGLNDYVHITGSVNNPEDYMSAMDIVLMPSIHEGLPLTLVEEQANGLTCLVSDAITTEANLTGNIHFLPLSTPVNVWCDKLLDLVQIVEVDRLYKSDHSITVIKEKGYDIFTEAKKLENFYNHLF